MISVTRIPHLVRMEGCVIQTCRTIGTAVFVLRGTTVRLHYSLSWLSDMCKLLKVFRSSLIYVFLCVSGYHCEDSYNVCDRGPCLNGGTCSVQNNSPVCLCPTGQLLHPTHPSPSVIAWKIDHCINLIRYLAVEMTYMKWFFVVEGYTGDFCEAPLSHCSCVHGTCRLSEGEYQCNCYEGFTGPR